jgi:hypothetical protein
MKTFLMIYNENTKELIDEYEEINGPQTTFNSWYLESDVSFEVFQNIIAFYFIGSDKKEIRKSGVIRYDKVNQKLIFTENPFYLIFNDEGLNYVHNSENNILWDDKYNNYVLAPENLKEVDEDELFAFALPLEVVIPSMDAFLEAKTKYHFFISEKGKYLQTNVDKPLKYKSFYKKCKICNRTTVLSIDDMLDGKKFNCRKCNELSKTEIKKMN